MASLAPGNGWFPRRQPYGLRGSPNSRNDKVERRQTLRTSRNAVEVRRSGNAGILLAAAGSRHVQETTVKPVDLPASESVMTGKAATSLPSMSTIAGAMAGSSIVRVGRPSGAAVAEAQKAASATTARTDFKGLR